MEIEQYPPNQSKFLVVVLLTLAFLFLFFVLAYLFVDFEGHHIHIRGHKANPNAQLVLPAKFSPELS